MDTNVSGIPVLVGAVTLTVDVGDGMPAAEGVEVVFGRVPGTGAGAAATDDVARHEERF